MTETMILKMVTETDHVFCCDLGGHSWTWRAPATVSLPGDWLHIDLFFVTHNYGDWLHIDLFFRDLYHLICICAKNHTTNIGVFIVNVILSPLDGSLRAWLMSSRRDETILFSRYYPSGFYSPNHHKASTIPYNKNKLNYKTNTRSYSELE
jgi:hypothetical protein